MKFEVHPEIIHHTEAEHPLRDGKPIVIKAHATAETKDIAIRIHFLRTDHVAGREVAV